MRRLVITGLVCAVVLGLPGLLGAAESALPNDLQSLTVYFENDLFTDTDRYYTNGVRVSWLSQDLEAAEVPAWAAAVRAALPWFHRVGWTNNIGLALGQNIYTPENTRTATPIPDDRPYAGWLYGAVALHHKNQTRLHMLELTLGVVGPEALGETTQNGIHGARDLHQAQGWDNQLGTEPGLGLTYEYRPRWPSRQAAEGLAADLIPCLRLTGGNVLTAATVGTTARVGYNLPRDFAGNRIHVSGYALPPADRATLEAGPAFSLYLFASLEGSVVAHNLLLEGNTWRDSLGVDRKPWVGEAEIGIGGGWGRYRATYAHVIRSREFDDQAGAQQYGSISLAVSF